MYEIGTLWNGSHMCDMTHAFMQENHMIPIFCDMQQIMCIRSQRTSDLEKMGLQI